jgi:hypothetical protein
MACVVLLVDLFVRQGPHWLTYLLAQLTLAGCAGITFFTLDGQAVTTFSNMFVDDLFADVLKLFLYPAVAMMLVYGRELPGRAQPRQGRVLPAGAVRHARHDGDDLGQPLAHGLPRPRAAGAVAVRHGGDRPRLGARHRGGDEVLRARRHGLRPAALRHVDGVRRDRHAWRSPRSASASRRRRQQDGAGVRPGLRGGRPGLQAGRGALPHVDSRRLSRRADGGDAVHRLGAEAGGLRHRHAPAGHGLAGLAETGR